MKRREILDNMVTLSKYLDDILKLCPKLNTTHDPRDINTAALYIANYKKSGLFEQIKMLDNNYHEQAEAAILLEIFFAIDCNHVPIRLMNTGRTLARINLKNIEEAKQEVAGVLMVFKHDGIVEALETVNEASRYNLIKPFANCMWALLHNKAVLFV